MIYYGEGYWWKGEGNLKPRPFEMSNPEIPKHLESTQKMISDAYPNGIGEGIYLPL